MYDCLKRGRNPFAMRSIPEMVEEMLNDPEINRIITEEMKRDDEEEDKKRENSKE